MPERFGSERESGCGALPAQPAMASVQTIAPRRGSVPASESRSLKRPAMLRRRASIAAAHRLAHASEVSRAVRIRWNGRVVVGSWYMIVGRALLREQNIRNAAPCWMRRSKFEEADTKLDRDRQGGEHLDDVISRVMQITLRSSRSLSPGPPTKPRDCEWKI